MHLSATTDLPAGLLGGVLVGASSSIFLMLTGKLSGMSGILHGWLTHAENPPWRVFYVAGLLTAGVVVRAVNPSLLGSAATTAAAISPAGAVTAGLLVGFGSRLGTGCTSGHGLCGLSRFSRRSLASVMTFMATGALTATAVRSVGGGLREALFGGKAAAASSPASGGALGYLVPTLGLLAVSFVLFHVERLHAAVTGYAFIPQAADPCLDDGIDAYAPVPTAEPAPAVGSSATSGSGAVSIGGSSVSFADSVRVNSSSGNNGAITPPSGAPGEGFTMPPKAPSFASLASSSASPSSRSLLRMATIGGAGDDSGGAGNDDKNSDDGRPAAAPSSAPGGAPPAKPGLARPPPKLIRRRSTAAAIGALTVDTAASVLQPRSLAVCLASYASALLFGLGLAVSGMTDPEKVASFLDFTGASGWDPSLMGVMGAGVTLNAVVFHLLRTRLRSPLLDSTAVMTNAIPTGSCPQNNRIDHKLLAGAALFGTGWGLAGVCPGPAVVAFGAGSPLMATFLPAMLGGMVAYELTFGDMGKSVLRHLRSSGQ